MNDEPCKNLARRLRRAVDLGSFLEFASTFLSAIGPFACWDAVPTGKSAPQCGDHKAVRLMRANMRRRWRLKRCVMVV